MTRRRGKGKQNSGGGEKQAEREIDRKGRTMRGTWAQEMQKEGCSEWSGWRRRCAEATMWMRGKRSIDEGKKENKPKNKQRNKAKTNQTGREWRR